jgi:hypothetical protein
MAQSERVTHRLFPHGCDVLLVIFAVNVVIHLTRSLETPNLLRKGLALIVDSTKL